MVSQEDLHSIQEKLGRTPKELELACFENLWSEHCSYRSTRKLLKTLPTTGKNVILGPGDDAAIVRFSENIAISIGMESHNHPSFVDPHDGAATGVGGIVRDIISMGSRPVALMDPLYFGTLDKEKNRYLMEHIIAGIGGYGNCIGVPVIRGETFFDDGYDGNPLVNVVCVGIVDPDRFLTARVKKPGSHLVLVGSSTGRDGIGGASFASRDLGENAEEEERPSVQIGDPFTEKLLIEAILEMAATGTVLSCRDLGAAGLAGASSEMCSSFGGHIFAEKVHLREQGMNPTEIMVSESQERMLLEVAFEDVATIGAIADRYDLKWSDIGIVLDEPRYLVTYNGETVCDLDVDFLTEGAGKCQWPSKPYSAIKPYKRPKETIKELCLAVLSYPEVASRSWIYEQYDHDVQIRTLSIGKDAGLIRLGDEALSLSCGCNPRRIYLDPFAGTSNAVIENVCNLACMGGEPLCIVDCLNFGSPEKPEVFWQIEESVKGLGEASRAMEIPIVGGNVSLYNESDENGTRIKPTPSLGLVGKGPVPTFQSYEDGDLLVLTYDKIDTFYPGGTVLDAVTCCNGAPEPVGKTVNIPVIRDLVRKYGLIATDISQGGLLAALNTISPDCEVTLNGDLIPALFSEPSGEFLIRCKEVPNEIDHFTIIGKAGGEGIRINGDLESVIITREELINATSSLSRLMRAE